VLDEKDLQAIRGLMGEQESRLNARIETLEQRLTARIEDQEQRLTAKIEDQEQRLTAKIEEAQQNAVADSMRYMNLLYENKIEPALQLLAEGQQTLLETLAPKNRVDALEEEVQFLKTVVSSLNREVESLKKAI